MLELNMMTETSILTADVLITDWSAISFEYAFGTEKPVLFINTPCKIVNQDYKSLNLEPIELTLRNQIGISIDIEEIPNIQTILQRFMEHKAAFQERIIRCREQYLYHWLHSAEIGGEFLINACSNREA
jgi:YidC/Oxa1 family membrane protein insertase